MSSKRKDRRRSHKTRQRLDGDDGFLLLNQDHGWHPQSEHNERRPLDFDSMEDAARRHGRRGDGQTYAAPHDDDPYDKWDEWDEWEDAEADEWDDDYTQH